jgi:hypothetical protein
MNYSSRLLTILLVVVAGAFIAGCDGDDPSKSDEESQLDKLRGVWNIQSVDNDGVDRSDEYPAMTVTISGTYTEGGTYNYTSDADEWPSVSPWKAVDTWKFKSGSIPTNIVRQSDLLDMTYTLSNSDQTLTILFEYSGPGFNNGRTESVSGEWEFVFTK